MTLNSSTLKFLIIGSDGQVGSAMCQLLSKREIPFVAIEESEITDSQTLAAHIANNAQYGFVVNALFEEPVEGAQPDLDAWLRYAQVIAENCLANEQILLQLSSALVFSGKSSHGYVETDECDASTALGLTFEKLEKLASSINPQSIILRSSWLFSEQVDNFLTRLVGAAIRQESLRFSGQLIGCPTDAHAVAKVFLGMAEQLDCGTKTPLLWGVYHYADSDACSMYTFAKTVITVVKSMAEVRVESIEKADSADMVDALATENYELKCKKILSNFGIKQRPWRRSVHEVLKEKFSSQM